MKFNSTRGKVLGCSFEEALFSPGYQADGGLLLPESYPKISREQLQSWTQLSFTGVFKEVYSLYVDQEEIPRKDLHGLIDRAFAKMDFPEVVRLKLIKGGAYVLEMFHSPTLAFKDLSLGVVGELMSYFLTKRGKHATMLVGTSGDTGSAAIEAVRGLKGMDSIVLYPSKGRITNIQEKSMTTVLEENVHVFGVDGTMDDLDVVLKGMSLDQEFIGRHGVGTTNSINIARVLGQAVSYFFTYLQLCPTCEGTVEVIVPSGSGGHISGGTIATAMGLPIRIIAAVSQNDILHRTFSKGDYSKKDVAQTLSPAIDIQNPYNMERVLHIISGQDSALVNRLCTEFESTGAVTIPETLLHKVSSRLSSFACHDEVVKRTMQQCSEENDGYLVCPHTAVGVACYYHRRASKQIGSSQPVALFATASPAKFPEAVRAAGLTPLSNPTVERWLGLPTQETQLTAEDDWMAILREKVERITRKAEGKSQGKLTPVA